MRLPLTKGHSISRSRAVIAMNPISASATSDSSMIPANGTQPPRQLSAVEKAAVHMLTFNNRARAQDFLNDLEQSFPRPGFARADVSSCIDGCRRILAAPVSTDLPDTEAAQSTAHGDAAWINSERAALDGRMLQSLQHAKELLSGRFLDLTTPYGPHPAIADAIDRFTAGPQASPCPPPASQLRQICSQIDEALALKGRIDELLLAHEDVRKHAADLAKAPPHIQNDSTLKEWIKAAPLVLREGHLKESAKLVNAFEKRYLNLLWGR